MLPKKYVHSTDPNSNVDLHAKYPSDHGVNNHAAIQIQSSFRGHLGRQAYTNKLIELFNEEEMRQREKQLLLIESHEEEMKLQQSIAAMQKKENLTNKYSRNRKKIISQQDGSTIFHRLAYEGNLNALRKLVNANSTNNSRNLTLNPFAVNNYGETCLHIAAGCGKVEVCLFLIEVCGLSVKSRTNFGDSVIDYARKNEMLSCVNLLLSYL